MAKEQFGLVDHLEHIRLTVRKHVEAWSFIKKHQVWKGFWKYGWVSKILMALAVLAGLLFLKMYFQWLGDVYDNGPVAAMGNTLSYVGDMVTGDWSFLFAGGMKYVIVILMEIVIYHSSRRTVKILTGQDEEASFNNFLKAQMRMISVSFRSWIMEIIATALIGVAFSFLFFIDFLEPVVVFGIQCFFLGFAVMDNYAEQFDMKIKESLKLSRKYLGVAIGTGLVLQIFFAIPAVGPVVGPFLSAVAVCLVMYHLTDIHLRPSPSPVEEVKTDDFV